MRKVIFIIFAFIVVFVVFLNLSLSIPEEMLVVYTPLGYTVYVLPAVFSPYGKYALSGSNDIKLWYIETSNYIKTFK